jgi:hypothetical protein
MNSRQISIDRVWFALRLRQRGCSFRYIAAVMRIGPERARTYVARGERLEQSSAQLWPLNSK